MSNVSNNGNYVNMYCFITKCNISNVGNISNESKFTNEDSFSYKSSNKKQKESSFMKD